MESTILPTSESVQLLYCASESVQLLYCASESVQLLYCASESVELLYCASESPLLLMFILPSRPKDTGLMPRAWSAFPLRNTRYTYIQPRQ